MKIEAQTYPRPADGLGVYLKRWLSTTAQGAVIPSPVYTAMFETQHVMRRPHSAAYVAMFKQKLWKRTNVERSHISQGNPARTRRLARIKGKSHIKLFADAQ